MIELDEMVRTTLENSKGYLKTFQQIASQKRRLGQKAQYKTEGWLQAILAIELLKRYEVIPECYTNEWWDLAIWERGVRIETEKPVLIEIKCLSASEQRGDRDRIKEDIDNLKEQRKEHVKYYLLVLPESQERRKVAYARIMKDHLINHFTEITEEDFKKIMFDDSEEEGICYLWKLIM